MKIFKNIFDNLGFTVNLNFKNLVKVRRAKLIEAGVNVDRINWDLYARVLEAKYELNKKS